MDSREILKDFSVKPVFIIIVTLIFILPIAASIFFGISLLQKDETAEAARFIKGYSDSGEYGYIDVVEVTNWICEVDKITYYTVFDADGDCYTVEMNKNLFDSLGDQYYYYLKNTQENPLPMPQPVRIYGMVEKINNDVKEGIASYWSLTTPEYEEYFGNMVLDTSSSYKTTAIPLFVLAAVFLFLWFTIIFLTPQARNARYSRKRLEKRTETERAAAEYVDPANESISFGKAKLVFSTNYLFSNSMKAIIKYDDIFWAYKFVYRFYGIVNTYLILCTKNKNKISALIIGKEKNEGIDRALELIAQHNSSALIGFDQPNINAFNNLTK